MAPFLRDEGPPVSTETIQRARECLPLEYGHQMVVENGRETLIVRVPKPKPDHMHDLADVAFYVSLDMIRDTKDVLLIGHDKASRVEPQRLRDHIRAQHREDAQTVADLRKRLERHYGQTSVTSPSNFQHRALAIRIPKASIAEFSPDDVRALRDMLQKDPERLVECQYGYIVADHDYERLGRRILVELVGDATGGGDTEPLDLLLAGTSPSMPESPELHDEPSAPAAAQAEAFPEASVRVPVTEPGAGRADASGGRSALPPPEASATAHEPVVETEEYEIMTRTPKPAPVPVEPEPVPAAAPEPAAAKVPTVSDDEYEIITRAPRAEPAAPPAVEAQPKPEPAASPAPPVAATDDEPTRRVEVLHDEYEIFTSKPRAPPRQAAEAAAPVAAPPSAAPTRTKEYEIIGRPTPRTLPRSAPAQAPAAPQSAHPPAATAPVPRYPAGDDPRFPLPRATGHAPSQDNGTSIETRVTPSRPEGILALRLREAGYELVESIRAQGIEFAFAAHREGGRRILVKRATTFGPDEAAVLAPLVVALGADVGLVVVDKPLPGVRLATWGTRLEILRAEDVETHEL